MKSLWRVLWGNLHQALLLVNLKAWVWALQLRLGYYAPNECPNQDSQPPSKGELGGGFPSPLLLPPFAPFTNPGFGIPAPLVGQVFSFAVCHCSSNSDFALLAVLQGEEGLKLTPAPLGFF